MPMNRPLLLLLFLISLSACKKSPQNSLETKELEGAWHLERSYIKNAQGEIIEDWSFLEKESWDKRPRQKTILIFKSNEELEYLKITERENADTLSFMGRWQWLESGKSLRYHPRKSLFDSLNAKQVWHLQSSPSQKIILSQAKLKGGSIFNIYRALEL